MRRPTNPQNMRALLLTDARIRELAELALAIERTFGSPQDIEWTIDGDGKLWIVQSRPITARRRPMADHGPTDRRTADQDLRLVERQRERELPAADFAAALFDRAVRATTTTSAIWERRSASRERRLRAMEPALRQIIGVHGARMYYNLTSIHSVLRSAPFGDLLARSFNQFVGAEETSASPRRRGVSHSAGSGARGDRGEDDLAVPVPHQAGRAIRTNS